MPASLVHPAYHAVLPISQRESLAWEKMPRDAITVASAIPGPSLHLALDRNVMFFLRSPPGRTWSGCDGR